MTGRPTILETDPEKVTAFLELVRGGISPSNAAPEAGLAENSWKAWQKRGREAEAKLAEGYELDEREELFRDFADRLQRARKRRILRLEQRLMVRIQDEEAKASPRDILAVLARVDPDNWGDPEKRVRVEHAGSIDTSGETSRLAAKIDDYEAAFAALEPEAGNDDGGD